jgi:CPA2 family monovalent cation:H+ antiporter-2
VSHGSSLITILVAGLGLAFILGTAANRLKLSPIAGYLLAGVIIGPFTPGFVADPNLTLQLAEVGVILLMFGVGLHFSLTDLLSVRTIVLPGAVLQVMVSTALGTGAGWLLGLPMPGGAMVFGLSLSIASTIVAMRVLQERRLLETERGRLLVGWLVVQDALTVIALVLLPPLAAVLREGGAGGLHAGALAVTLGLTLAKFAAFVLLMWVVGRRVIPAVLHHIAHTGSRELFRLAVLSVALGVAYAAAAIFGVSIALGAFFAGVILSESKLSQQAAAESLPFRDAFAVLFFVSVGMLFNPLTLVHEPRQLLLALLVVLFGTSTAVFLILRMFGHSPASAFFIAAALAQIGEFSFILMDIGVGLKLIPLASRDFVLGASILAILLNPALMALADAIRRRLEPAPLAPEDKGARLAPTSLRQHAVIVGYGRVGRLVADGLLQLGVTFLVIEDAADAVDASTARAFEFIAGNAANEQVLGAAALPQATMLFVAIPQAFEAGQIVEQARRANPGLHIVARAHFDAEIEHLRRLGADEVVMGEREIARAMVAFARAHAPTGDGGRQIDTSTPHFAQTNTGEGDR